MSKKRAAKAPQKNHKKSLLKKSDTHTIPTNYIFIKTNKEPLKR